MTLWAASAPVWQAIAAFRHDRLVSLTFEAHSMEVRREASLQALRQENAAAVARERNARRWCELDDPEAILDFWAANPIDPDEAPVLRRYAEWLRGGSPDTWHEAATSWNWDHGIAPIIWVIRQPDCDMATPIELYFSGCGYSQRLAGTDRSAISEDYLEQYDMLIELRDRLATGFYKRQEIAFDGRRAFEMEFGVDAPVQDDEIFRRTLSGRTIVEDYPSKSNGIPEEWRFGRV